jgi:hypothetical protein
MQGGKNWITERDKCKPVLLRLSLAGNLEKTLMSHYVTMGPNEGSLATGYGFWLKYLFDS